MDFENPCVIDGSTAYLDEIISSRLSFAIWLIDDFTQREPIGNIRLAIKDGNDTLMHGRYGKPFKNPGGFYIFTDLPDKNYNIDIESDFYFPEKNKEVSTSEIQARNLKFDTTGPKEKATSVMLKEALGLKTGYVVEFRNPDGRIEDRSIKAIKDSTIFWTKPLAYGFNTERSTISTNYVFEIVLKPNPVYPFPDAATLVRGTMSEIEPEDPPLIRIKDSAEETKTDRRGDFALYLKGIKEKEIIIEIIRKDQNPQPIKTLKIKDGENISLGKI
ncbi:MAG: hypothetical protein E4G94_09210 [ANME-2 cluster archaeon]|nr:MAG: hypothetical protein E4G94_09210 [ANME-2 cluster archaeon]